MDMAEFWAKIDKQIKEQRERYRRVIRGDRRQCQVPVAEDRRSGEDRRCRIQRKDDA